MATKVGMYSATHESVSVARGQRQENTDRVTNQIAGIVTVTVSSEKKQTNKEYYDTANDFNCASVRQNPTVYMYDASANKCLVV